MTETLRLLALALELYGGQPDGKVLQGMRDKLAEVQNARQGTGSPGAPQGMPAGDVPEEAAPEEAAPEGGEPPPEEGAPGTRNNEGGGEVMDAAALRKLPRNPSRDQLWALSRAVAKVLPGKGNAERFLYETAGAESQWGAHPDTFRKGYHGGVFQVDRKGFEDTLATESHRKNLRRHYDTIRKAFGVDWTTVKYEDIRDKPLLGALAARLLIANKPDAVPGDAEGRARYWKRHYNSYHENAKGTVEEYLKRNGFPLPTGFKE